MPKNKETEEREDDELEDAEESDDKDTEDETEDDSEEESEDEAEDDSEDDSESDDKNLEDEDEEDDEDIDAELERERKGKPDPKKAQEAFLARKGKKKDDSEDDDGDDKPITQKQLNEILEKDRKERQELDAFAIAKTLTKKANVAELLVEKWKNRTFPAHLSLQEQMVEVYGATFAKRLIGEKNEALRALGNKGRVNRDGSTAHRDSQAGKGSPKLPPADIAAIKAAGFEWKNNRFEKRLANGGLLIRDPKTRKTIFQRPKSR